MIRPPIHIPSPRQSLSPPCALGPKPLSLPTTMLHQLSPLPKLQLMILTILSSLHTDSKPILKTKQKNNHNKTKTLCLPEHSSDYTGSPCNSHAFRKRHLRWLLRLSTSHLQCPWMPAHPPLNYSHPCNQLTSKLSNSTNAFHSSWTWPPCSTWCLTTSVLKLSSTGFSWHHCLLMLPLHFSMLSSQSLLVKL